MDRVQCTGRGISNGTEESELQKRSESVMSQENLYMIEWVLSCRQQLV